MRHQRQYSSRSHIVIIIFFFFFFFFFFFDYFLFVFFTFFLVGAAGLDRPNIFLVVTFYALCVGTGDPLLFLPSLFHFHPFTILVTYSSHCCS